MNAHDRRMRVVYRFWAPFYDLLVRAPVYRRGRERAHQLLATRPSERILLVGCGTGADLPLLPQAAIAVGVDISRPMLLRARQKSSSAREILLIEASAAELPLADESFDAVMCILILSVVGDPRRCLQDALRVLRQGGRLVVFDKFAPEGRGVSTIRGAVNCVTRAFGTDINRRWNEISRGCNAEIQQEHSVTSGGSFRLILLRKVPLVEPPAAVPGERPYQ